MEEKDKSGGKMHTQFLHEDGEEKYGRRKRHLSRYHRPSVQSQEDIDIYLLKSDKRFWQVMEQ